MKTVKQMEDQHAVWEACKAFGDFPMKDLLALLLYVEYDEEKDFRTEGEEAKGHIYRNIRRLRKWEEKINRRPS